MTRFLAILFATSVAGPAIAQDPELPLVSVSIRRHTGTEDLWEELRKVDPGYKEISAEIDRLKKGLEAEDVAVRDHASVALKALGLAALKPLKEARDREPSGAVKRELDALLKSMIGNGDKELPLLPGARKIGAQEAGPFRDRFIAINPRGALPKLTVFEGQWGKVSIQGEEPLGHRKRRITIEGNGTGLKVEGEGERVLRVSEFAIKPTITDVEKQIVTLEIVATLQEAGDKEPFETVLNLSPKLGPGESYLAGPFPAANPKDKPWWVYIEAKVTKP